MSAGSPPRAVSAWSLEIASRGRPAEDAARAAGVADVPRWERWTSSLRKASEAWATRGFARTFDRAAADWDVLPRLLSQPEGERHATDLRHLFELAHAAERANRLGPGALAEWLRAQGAASEEGAKQRLESDDDAVRIVTIHTSKGLEYPIVLLPFAGLVPSSEDKGYPIVLRRESPPRVDLSPARSSARAVAVRAAEEEARREAMRKAYVALTRARHQTVLWYGPIGREGKSVSASPYGRLLLRDPAAATLDDARLPDFKADPAAAWEETRARLDALCATSGDTIAWVGAERPGALGLWEPAASAPAPVVTRAEWPESRGALEGRWIVASYTALSRGSAAPASTPDLDERSRHDDATLVGLLDGEAMQLDSSERDWSERDGSERDGSERDGSERDGSERDSSDLDRPQLARPQTAPRVRGTAAGSLDAAAPSGVDAQAPFALARPAELAFDDYAEPRLSLGRGTRYGSFVHEVFEALDFETGLALDGSDLAPRVAELARAQGLPRDGRQADELVQQLPRLLRTPLGSESSESPLRGLPADFTLAQLGRRDRLDELAFDLRLGAGTRYRRVESNASSRGDTTYAREGVSADGIAADGEAARLLARPGCVEPAAVYAALARETCTDGVADWLRFQRHRAAQGRALVGSSAGVLTGSIDLVFRVRDGDEHRYFLADYKTNKIEGSSPGHYARAWMAWKMAEAGYPLQALLYTLALHRHLRLRLGPERYDYDRHLGGYLYLFVRGMAGPSTPRDVDGGHCLGVFAHRWSKETVEALDLALAPEDSP
jgi:exodeoxyribonuclease V beta subunit